jgi:DNA-binding MarR family transcriptional regulator
MSGSAELSTTDALAQASFVVQGALERRAAHAGLSMIQVRLLGVLRDREPTINELSALLGLDKSSVSGLVDRAERRGVVTRRPSETDRRSVRVSLTSEGRGLVEAVAARVEADLKELLGPLAAAERRTLTTLLSRVLVAHADRHGVDLFPPAGPRDRE